MFLGTLLFGTDYGDRESDSWGDLEFKCNYKLVSNPLVVMNTSGYIDIMNPLDASDREIAIELAAVDKLILEGKLDLSRFNRDRDGESNA